MVLIAGKAFSRSAPLLLMAVIATVSVARSAHAASPWSHQPDLPTGRAQAAIGLDRSGRIHVVGGYVGQDTIPVATHEIFPGPDGRWTAGVDLPNTVRGPAGTVGLDGRLYVIGGFDGTTQSGSAYALELDGGWTRLPDTPTPAGWETRAETGADGKIYVFGGGGPELSEAGAALGLVNSRTFIFDPRSRFLRACRGERYLLERRPAVLRWPLYLRRRRAAVEPL